MSKSENSYKMRILHNNVTKICCLKNKLKNSSKKYLKWSLKSENLLKNNIIKLKMKNK